MRLIDADALINKAYFHGEVATYDNPFANGVDAVDVDDIINAPTIEAEPVKRGKWVRITDMFYKCSECECAWYCQTVELCGINYCPNCGARMVEE